MLEEAGEYDSLVKLGLDADVGVTFPSSPAACLLPLLVRGGILLLSEWFARSQIPIRSAIDTARQSYYDMRYVRTLLRNALAGAEGDPSKGPVPGTRSANALHERAGAPELTAHARHARTSPRGGSVRTESGV